MLWLCIVTSVLQACIAVQGKSYNPPPPPRAVTFSWWGIAYLNDQDSYAGWSLYSW